MSTIPVVIAALVELAEATLNSDNWQVIDGPVQTTTGLRERVVTIGEDEILSPTDVDSFGGASSSERYTVPLLVSVSLPGPDSLPAARVEAFAAHADLCAAVEAAPDRNLGLTAQGVVDAMPRGDRRIQQYATENGRSVTVRFGIDIYSQTT